MASRSVALPPLPEQQAIFALLTNATAKLNALIAEAERAIALLQERRTALISAAVTGKIDVRGCAPTGSRAREQSASEKSISKMKSASTLRRMAGSMRRAIPRAMTARVALFPTDVIAWLEETQPEAWEDSEQKPRLASGEVVSVVCATR